MKLHKLVRELQRLIDEIPFADDLEVKVTGAQLYQRIKRVAIQAGEDKHLIVAVEVA